MNKNNKPIELFIEQYINSQFTTQNTIREHLTTELLKIGLNLNEINRIFSNFDLSGLIITKELILSKTVSIYNLYDFMHEYKNDIIYNFDNFINVIMHKNKLNKIPTLELLQNNEKITFFNSKSNELQWYKSIKIPVKFVLIRNKNYIDT